MKPKVLVLKADGINRDEEMAYAFKIAGGDPKIVHVNELRNGRERLSNYNILALPGGFAYGDDIVSGKILAIELISFLGNEMKKFIKREDTAIIGVCNGFQVLVRTGLLPFRKIGQMQVTLTNNDSGHFECRWVNLKVEKSKCKFSEGLIGSKIFYPIAHGEGKFITDAETLKEIEDQGLVVFRYSDEKGNPTMEYPKNPNGALNSIAGICDVSGRILGLMPHPECFVRKEQHPNFRRGKVKVDGLPLIENIIKFVKGAK
ncbi:phosphoribosylformylglycinamidine synthase I [Patescibacteria group bacterium]|nr:phosphoribosylformylglycinamidine synthase I [Patescibacteria group bacterium]